MTTNDETYKKYKSYYKRILDFDHDANQFKPSHYTPAEDGVYVTIRCGLSGIYQILDRYENGDWQLRVLDGSRIIAYSRYTVEL